MVASERPAPRHVPRTRRPPFPGPRGAQGGRTGGRTGGVQGAYRGWVTSRGPFLLGTPLPTPALPPVAPATPLEYVGRPYSEDLRSRMRRERGIGEEVTCRRTAGSPRVVRLGAPPDPATASSEGGRAQERESPHASARPSERKGGRGRRTVGWLVGFSQGRQTLRRGLPPPHGGAGRFSSGFFATGPPTRSPERREGGVA